MKFNLGPAQLDVTYTRHADGTGTTRFSVFGKTFEGWQALAQRKFDEYVRWGRHLAYRASVAMIGFTFVASLNAGPWITTLYAVALIGAGDLALRFDRTSVDTCECGRRFIWWPLPMPLAIRRRIGWMGHAHRLGEGHQSATGSRL